MNRWWATKFVYKTKKMETIAIVLIVLAGVLIFTVAIVAFLWVRRRKRWSGLSEFDVDNPERVEISERKQVSLPERYGKIEAWPKYSEWDVSTREMPEKVIVTKEAPKPSGHWRDNPSWLETP